MKLFNRCNRKGHEWLKYGVRVMGFGPYIQVLKCSRCDATMNLTQDELKEYEKDEAGPD